MRLGTCIALELAVAASAIGGVWFGVGRAGRLADEYLAHNAAAAPATVDDGLPKQLPPPAVAPLPAATLDVGKPPVEATSTIFAQSDADLLAPLGAAPLKASKLNRGGTSLSMRLDFTNGARASFKPEQTFPQSDPRREIAAYRIDRLLRIGHVSPTKVARFAVHDLYMTALPDYKGYTMDRMEEEATQRNGFVYGELQWWIPEITLARLGPYQLDEYPGRELWSKYLQVGATIPVEHRPLVEQISLCIVFDMIIDNGDRWSGNNTQMSPDGKTLYFMDNTLSFSIYTFGHPMAVEALHRVQVFSRGLVRRLRELTKERVVAALGSGEGLGRLLNNEEITAILGRRDRVLSYIDGLIAKYGEDSVLGFP